VKRHELTPEEGSFWPLADRHHRPLTLRLAGDVRTSRRAAAIGGF
jgi:hypothetical protein